MRPALQRIPYSFAGIAEANGLKYVQRGAQYGRLMLGEQKLVVARGLMWKLSILPSVFLLPAV